MSYDLIALLIVLAIPFAALYLFLATMAWARDAIRRAPIGGPIGVFATMAASGNLIVARACGGDTNRPVITLVTGHGSCLRLGLISLEVVLLVAVWTSTAVRLGDVRR